MHLNNTAPNPQQYSIDVPIPAIAVRGDRQHPNRTRKSKFEVVVAHHEEQQVNQEDISLALALKFYKEACDVKRVEKFYQDALLEVIDDLPEEEQAEILNDQVDNICAEASNYQSIVGEIEQRGGLIKDLEYRLEELSYRRGLSLSQLQDSLERLTKIRSCTLSVIEQFALWRQKLKGLQSRTQRFPRSKNFYEPPSEFPHKGKAVLQELSLDLGFLKESILDLYLSFEKSDPLLLGCRSKYPGKTSPAPIKSFLKINKQDMVRLYQASSILSSLTYTRPKRQPTMPKPTSNMDRRSRESKYISEQITETLRAINRPRRRMPEADAVSLNLHYLRQSSQRQQRTQKHSKSVSVNSLEVRSVAINTTNTHYYEKEQGTQTIPFVEKKALSEVNVGYETPKTPQTPNQPPKEQSLLESNLFPRINRIQLMVAQSEVKQKSRIQSLPSISRKTIYMEGRIIGRSGAPNSKDAGETRSRRKSSAKQIVVAEESPTKRSQSMTLEETVVPDLGRQDSSLKGTLSSVKEDQQYMLYPESIQDIGAGYDVVPLSLTIRGLQEYIEGLSKYNLKPYEIAQLRELLLAEPRKLTHYYLQEVRKKGKLIAFTALHPTSINAQRVICIVAFVLLNVGQGQLEPLLDSYIEYVWKNDPCERLYFLQHLNDISTVIAAHISKKGFEKCQNKLTWKQLSPSCYSAPRTIECKFQQAEQSTLQFELQEVLVDFTPSGTCQSPNIESPNPRNCFEEVVASELVRCTVQKGRVQLTKDKKDMVGHLSIKPADIVKGKIAIYPNTKELNEYLEDVVLDSFNTLDGLGDIYLSVTRFYDSFTFDYMMDEGMLYLRTDGVNSFFGRSMDYQYLLLKIPRGTMDFYLVIADELGQRNQHAQGNQESLKIRTKRFLQSTLNSPEEQRLRVDRTLLGIRLFRKHLYGRLANVDNRFSIFMRLHLNLSWTDYLEGAKRFGLTEHAEEFSRPFFVVAMIKDGDVYRPVTAATINQEDFLSLSTKSTK